VRDLLFFELGLVYRLATVDALGVIFIEVFTAFTGIAFDCFHNLIVIPPLKGGRG
jgi:hypothetical protein